ncbi:hypothetical protein ACEYYH_12240 [Microbacterium trichothecenolyticum]|uniref:hypothetical protein n=1 Tax=Microbacterium trichothecenolyticum TaxID=69370 RepID=UPI0035BE82DA
MKMNKKLGIVIAAASTTLVAALTVTAISSAAGASERPDFTTLHTAQKSVATAVDELPDVLLASGNAGDLQTDTSRHLGRSDAAGYWSVLHADGRLCLIVAPTADDVIVGSCSSEDAFVKHGLVLSVQDPADPAKSFAAFLLPAAATRADVPTGFEKIGTSVLERRDANGGVPETTIGVGESAVQLRGVEKVGR